MPIKELIKNNFAILKNEEIEILFTILHQDALMSTPFNGILNGHTRIKEFIIKEREWLLDKNAKLDVINVISSEQRLIFEFQLTLQSNQNPITLPFCVALDITDGMVQSIRLYYNTYPVTGKHYGITPLLQPSQDEKQPYIITQFISALQQADITKILSLFEDDASIQESQGSPNIHQGKEPLKHFFTTLCKNGGIPLQPCTITDDGTLIAVEHIFTRWKDHVFDPQAGILVFYMGSNGKISSLRIYDDI